jgi:hypothetical protein
MNSNDAVEKAAERIVELEAELEAAGNASTGGDQLAFARAALHAWVDSVVGVVTSPGVGRVTLIHQDGHESKIASPSLPFQLSRPVTFPDRKG